MSCRIHFFRQTENSTHTVAKMSAAIMAGQVDQILLAGDLSYADGYATPPRRPDLRWILARFLDGVQTTCPLAHPRTSSPRNTPSTLPTTLLFFRHRRFPSSPSTCRSVQLSLLGPDFEHLSSIDRLYIALYAPWGVLNSAPMLIGACNPMLCPIHLFSYAPRWDTYARIFEYNGFDIILTHIASLASTDTLTALSASRGSILRAEMRTVGFAASKFGVHCRYLFANVKTAYVGGNHEVGTETQLQYFKFAWRCLCSWAPRDLVSRSSDLRFQPFFLKTMR